MDSDQLKTAIGRTSMDVMDTVDQELTDQAQIVAVQCEVMASMLRDRGLESRHAIQLVTSFAAGAAYA